MLKAAESRKIKKLGGKSFFEATNTPYLETYVFSQPPIELVTNCVRSLRKVHTFTFLLLDFVFDSNPRFTPLKEIKRDLFNLLGFERWIPQ